MAKDLAKWAKQKGVKYFMISYTDLFGGQRAKLVPTQAINEMAVDGAGFAGFATWLDLTPAHPDLMAVPDPESAIQLPWKANLSIKRRAMCWSGWSLKQQKMACA
jgi:glutamate---methylamine ligase